jgi:hypothetical protein
MTRSWMWVALIPLLLVACDDGAGVGCLPAGVAAISVHALSAADSAPVLDARGEVRDGAYADSLVGVGQGFYEAAQNRPGRYDVHLVHAGYAEWDTSGIVVNSVGDGCPLFESRTVEARLVPIE